MKILTAFSEESIPGLRHPVALAGSNASMSNIETPTVGVIVGVGIGVGVAVGLGVGIAVHGG